jgi:hypothetical protein
MYALQMSAVSSRDGKRRTAILCKIGGNFVFQMKPERIKQYAVSFGSVNEAAEYAKKIHLLSGETLHVGKYVLRSRSRSNPCGTRRNPSSRETHPISVLRQLNGSLLLATVVNGHRIAVVYMGSTLKEAKAEFRQFVKEEIARGRTRYNPTYDEDMDEGMDEEGYVISDTGRLGSLYSVNRLSGTFREFRDAIKAIVADMNRQQYWPSVYYVDDHGNVDTIAIRIGKRGITYKTVRSRV